MKKRRILWAAIATAAMFFTAVGIQTLLGARIGIPELLITALIILVGVAITTALTSRRRPDSPSDDQA